MGAGELGKMALGMGMGALGGGLGGGEGQDLYSFIDDSPGSAGIGEHVVIDGNRVSIDPRFNLGKGVLANQRLGQGLTEYAEQDPSRLLGPQTLMQTPGYVHGGGLPMPIGINVSDPGWAYRGKLNLKNPFLAPGGAASDTGGQGDGEDGGGPPPWENSPPGDGQSPVSDEAPPQFNDAEQMRAALRLLGMQGGEDPLNPLGPDRWAAARRPNPPMGRF